MSEDEGHDGTADGVAAGQHHDSAGDAGGQGAESGSSDAAKQALEHALDPARLDFSGLRAIFINCTLKPSPETSHTAGLMEVAAAIMRAQGVEIDEVRAVDHAIAPGVYPDMRERGFPDDAWPPLLERVMAADILVLGTPIWLGDKSSVCARVVERLYAQSGELNERGQYAFYGKAAGMVITGNEDGVKHVAMNLAFSMAHLGYSIPPNPDCGWIGEAGPGPSYLDDDSGGPQNDFTQRNTTFMAWNLMHLAAMLREHGGFPAWGNQRSLWDAGYRFDHPSANSARVAPPA